MLYTSFEQVQPTRPLPMDELELVRQLARALSMHLDDRRDLISTLHVHNAQSQTIQGEVGRILVEQLGFKSEVLVTRPDGFTARPRADFFRDLGEDSGVIAEVERGGTTANNHDLKDLWKAHLAPDVRHLFLVVPNELFSESGRVRERPFPKVARRMSAFFSSPRAYVDVASVHLFGY